MLQFLRVLALIVLITISVLDFKFLSFVLKKEWMYLISTLIVLVMIFVDTITGFILALAIITLIIKMYNVRIPWGYTQKNKNEKTMDYITPEHLRSAQDNVIIAEEQYNKEWHGIQGVHGEQVYGAQGLEILPGFSTEVTDNV